MCQLFNGISGAIFAGTTQLAVMAPVGHQDIAVVLAILGLFGSIGASIGMAIAGALWTNVLPGVLYDALPEASKNMTAEIYGDMVLQLSYPMGDPVRDAIIEAYADVQRKMVIAGSAFIPLLLLAVIMWRNLKLKELDEKRGNPGNVW
jgi:hypothetical protein